jgi:Tol biopolymer transport system component
LDLDDANDESPDAPPPGFGARWRRRAIEWSLLVAAGAIATTLLSGYWRSPSVPPAEAMRFSLVTNFAGVEAQPSLAPDGRSVAFVSNRDGQWDLYVGLVTGGGLVRLTNDANIEERPRWSPDGNRILFSRLNESGAQDIWLTPSFPGTARRVVVNAGSPAWSADGRRIVYSSANVIWMADADGSNARQVSTLEPQPMFHDHPALSHDGKSLAFIRRRLGPRSEVVHLQLATGKMRSLTTDDSLALSPVWSPDDRFLYFSSSRGGTMNIWRLTVATSEATQITAGQGDDSEIDLSADGTRLVFSTYRANTNLVEIGLEPSAPGRRIWLTRDLARSETAPRYSPDGTRIAYFTNRSGAEREGIWVMSADGGNPTQVVEDAGRTNVYPRWSPDGNTLVFYSRSGWAGSSPPELRRVALAGGAPEPLKVTPWFPFFGWGDIAKDGRILYRTDETTAELFDPTTNHRQSVSDLPGDPMWSHDGGSFAYAVRGWGSRTHVKPGLWVSGIDQPRRLVFEGWVIWFAWARNGDLVFIEGRPDLKGVLWRLSPSGQRREVLKEIPFFKRPADGYWIARFDIHPDGRRIVVEGLESYESDLGMIEMKK